MYVAPPVVPARFLIFHSESLSLSLAVGNVSDQNHIIRLGNIPLAQAFRLTVVHLPPGGVVPTLRIEPIATIMTGDNSLPVPAEGAITIPPRGSAVWTGVLEAPGGAQPGVYELQIVPAFAGEAGEPLNPLGTIIRFEVRDVGSDQDRIELARRRMMHAYITGGDVEAAAAADSLIALYPQSALAYQVKGEIAKRAGRRPEASAAMQQALSLIVSGRDALYLRNVPARDVDRNVQGLAQAVQDLRPR
jgi:hypothetical protein